MAMSFTSLLHRAHWFENPGHMTGENITTSVAQFKISFFECVCVYASPSPSEDSCVGSGVVLLLSVFWLQLDG